MSCRHASAIPHPDNVCLDCECLAPDKCIEHGPHGTHDTRVTIRNGGVGEWACHTCNVWLRDEKKVTHANLQIRPH